MRSEGTGWEHIDFNMFTPMSRIFMPVVIK
jgi:hypothetical protein